MAVREVLRYPNPLLKRGAEPIAAESRSTIELLAADLVDTMRAHAGCVGLAAPQFGELVRAVVVDVTGHRKATTSNGLLVLLNPEIVEADGAEVGREGCLSIPEFTANVRRATRIRLRATGLDGARRDIQSEGFEARCLQHELDHLDGILFLDRVDSLTSDVFRRRRSR